MNTEIILYIVIYILLMFIVGYRTTSNDGFILFCTVALAPLAIVYRAIYGAFIKEFEID